MKQISIYLSVICSILICITSCDTKKSVYEDNTIGFDTIRTVQNYHLNNDSTQPSCNLKMDLIFPTSYENGVILDSMKQIFLSTFFDKTYRLSSIEDAMRIYGETYINNYKEDVQTFSKNKEDQERGKDDFFSYYETINNEIFYNKGDILSFQVRKSNYKGGANSYEFLRNYVIDLKSGKLLTEDDIFKPGYEKLLTPIFNKKLLEINKVRSLEELESIGYFGIEEMVPNDNFLIDNKEITYIFNKGEYSVYKLDEIKISIPFSDLSLILKDNSPLNSIIK